MPLIAFVLHVIIELYQSVRIRAFCDFIDYHKALEYVDVVVRLSVWFISSLIILPRDS